MKEAVLHPPTGRGRSFRPGPDHPADIHNAPENASQERLVGMGHGEPWNASSENQTRATKEDGTMHAQGTAFCTDETVPSRSVERKGAWKPRPMHKPSPHRATGGPGQTRTVEEPFPGLQAADSDARRSYTRQTMCVCAARRSLHGRPSTVPRGKPVVQQTKIKDPSRRCSCNSCTQRRSQSLVQVKGRAG